MNLSRFLNVNRSIPLYNYDVLIIGSGVVGAGLAYELSQYPIKLAILEQHNDVGNATSKGNSAIVHTGFDATPNTLESSLVTQASLEWTELSAKLKIPYRTTGAILVARTQKEKSSLISLQQKAYRNHVLDIRILSPAEAIELEPVLAYSNIQGALYIPRESIADPFATVSSYMDIALANGVDLFLNSKVISIEKKYNDHTPFKVYYNNGNAPLTSSIVINAAGLGGKEVSKMYKGTSYNINPRRGQFLIYDKPSSLKHIILPPPSETTKGMLLAPTIFGNVIGGPTAEDLPYEEMSNDEGYSKRYSDQAVTTSAGIKSVKESVSSLIPSYGEYKAIGSYAGLRCNCAEGSYLISYNDNKHHYGGGLITITGIRSTGFTTSHTLAKHIVSGMQTHIHNFKKFQNKKPEAVSSRVDYPVWYSPDPTPSPNVCYCEKINRASLIKSLNSPTKPITIDAIKRRTRIGMGRCSGFNCLIPSCNIISSALNIPLNDIKVKSNEDSSTFLSVTHSAPTTSHSSIKPLYLPHKSFYQAVIVGGGPAGIGCALALNKYNIKSIIIERQPFIGGIPASYTYSSLPSFFIYPTLRASKVIHSKILLPSAIHGNDYSRYLVNELKSLGGNNDVLSSSTVTEVINSLDTYKTVLVTSPFSTHEYEINTPAIILATGAREANGFERGVIGKRSLSLFTNSINQQEKIGCELKANDINIVSDDLAVASILASSLRKKRVSYRITSEHSILYRIFAHLCPGPSIKSIAFNQTPIISKGENLLYMSHLLPNLELVLSNKQSPLNGWFIAGNASGKAMIGHRCFNSGIKVAQSVAYYLKKLKY